jgi:hypothetical protein
MCAFPGDRWMNMMHYRCDGADRQRETEKFEEKPI